MINKWLIRTLLVITVVWIVSLQAAQCQLGPDWNSSDDWQFDGFSTPTPTPIAPTPTTQHTTTTIGNSLLTNLALFAVLPIAIGACAFFVVIKATENGEGSTLDMIAPITIATVAIILTEILVYMAVFVISALG